MRKRNGFTLIELVVVILILGILAGVAAPKLFKTSASATDNGLRQTLGVVRDAIELYAAKNGGALPPCSGTGADFQAAIKPHIRGDFPKCPVGPPAAQNSDITVSTANPLVGVASPTTGWAYNATTGEFICNYSGNTASDTTVTYDSL